MSISVIIPTYNRADMVCRCVESVLATGYSDLEVIVVDDCSTDDTSEKISSLGKRDNRVKCHRNDKNSCLGFSRNRGASLASGEILFFLDDDNILDHDCLKGLAEEFENHSDDGVVAPVAVNHGGNKEGLVWTLGCDFNRWTSQPNNYYALGPYAEMPKDKTRFPSLYSPNAFAVRKSVFQAAGGFDESLTFYFDESDFSWRVKDLGYSNWIIATAITHHHNFVNATDSVTLRELGINTPWRAFYLGRNRYPFVRKHFSWPQILSVYLVFGPLACLYYCAKAIQNHRPDIARAYLRGTFVGIFGLSCW